MASGFLDRLKDGPVLGDGGYYLELERRCLGNFEKGVPWAVLDHPEGLLQLHREFALAGAEVLQAMTWGVGRMDRDEELHRTAVGLAREAAGPDRLVAGTLSPAGVGPYQRRSPISANERREAQAFFERRVGQQIDAGVDLFIVETFYSVEEASLGMPYIKSAGVPVVVTLEYKSGEYTSDRYLPDEAAKTARGPWRRRGGRELRPGRGICTGISLRKMMGAGPFPSAPNPWRTCWKTARSTPGRSPRAPASISSSATSPGARWPTTPGTRGIWASVSSALAAEPCRTISGAMAEAIGKPTAMPDRPGAVSASVTAVRREMI